ncbi:BPSL0067 family protein [Caballeronia sp. BCC1704]|uniref:BPSL0067 family protein n=1 Tax=Caballeronia sp. BCC1704 TaxID=2676300 RepID=UPI00158B66F7|nr:BPSL0067 family protein [Caballeronia sp. BCC1704]
MSYRYSDAANLEGTDMVGSHQCVDLVKHYAHAPATALWREGTPVMDTPLIPVGTAIATFVKGEYRSHPHGNHAAFFLRSDGHCIWVMDQWANDEDNKPVVSSRAVCRKGRLKNGRYVDPSNNADAFSIIE